MSQQKDLIEQDRTNQDLFARETIAIRQNVRHQKLALSQNKIGIKNLGRSVDKDKMKKEYKLREIERQIGNRQNIFG